MIREIARHLAAASLAIAVAGCAGVPARDDCRDEIEYRLYFGGDTPAGEVTPAQWAAFLAESLTPRFPEGLTVYDARGQWRDTRGRVLGEPTRVVEVLRAGSAQDDADIALAAKDYRERFRQESVLVTRRAARACY